MPRVTTLLVEAARGGLQQTRRDLRDQDGTGGVIEQVLSYRDDGVHLVSLRLRTAFAGVTRTYSVEPSEPSLVLRTGARSGERYRLELTGDGVSIRTDVTVEGSDRILIQGSMRDVLIVRLSSTFHGEIEGTQVAVNAIDRDLSLTVREDVRADFRQGAVRIRSAYVATLRSTEPS